MKSYVKISSRFRESQILWFFRWFPHINRFVDQNKWFPHISRFVDQTMKICEETDNSLKCERANIYINIAKHLRSAERDISASWFSTFWAFWTCFGGFYPLNSANVSPHKYLGERNNTYYNTSGLTNLYESCKP